MTYQVQSYYFDNPIIARIAACDKAGQLSLDELIFIDNYGNKNRGYATVVLPYALALDIEIVDSIAKKLRMNKFFRGPRSARSRRGGVCRTLKKDATGVALYPKYY